MAKGGSNVTQVESYSDIPERYRTFVDENLSLAGTLANRAYTPYQGQRVAGFTGDQQSAFNAVRNLPNQYGGMIANANQALTNAATPVQAQGYNPATFQASQANAALMDGAQGYNAAQAGFTGAGFTSYNPATINGTAYNPSQANFTGAGSTGYNARGYDATDAAASLANRGNIRDVNAVSGASQMAQYQNPYTDQVVDASLRDLDRSYKMSLSGIGARASGAGAYGGSRQAVAESEAARNFMDVAGNLAANLRQAGYNTAAGLGQTDASRMLQAAGQNQSADQSTTALNAQLGTNVGLNNASARNAAAQYGADASNSAAQFGAQASNVAGLQNASQANSMALANMGALNDASRYNADSTMQSRLANQASQNAAGQFGASAANTAQLSNASQANQLAAQNAAADNAARQFTAGSQNAAQSQNAQLATQAALANAASQNAALEASTNALNQGGQFNAQQANAIGQQNAANQLAAGQAFGNLGNLTQNLGINYANALSGIGQQQQGLNQAGLDIGYGDFLQEFNYPYQALALRQSAIGQTPMGSVGMQPVVTQQNGIGGLLGGLGGLASGIGAFF